MVAYMAAPGCKQIKKLQSERLNNSYIIFNTVCRIFGYLPETVIINNTVQKREYVVIRQITMTLFVIKLKYTLRRAGEFFGGKDHTTVKHSIKTVKGLLETNKQFKEDVGYLFIDVVFPDKLKRGRKFKTERIN